MNKYLYLSKVNFAHAWVNGGKIPLFLASTYFSNDREGKLTPDELLVHESPIPIPSLRQHGFHIENCRDITLIDCSSNLGKIPDIVNGNYFHQDGLVLCLSNIESHEIAKRLGDKEVCVKLTGIEKLRKTFDKQLGAKGKMGECQYTDSHQRNAFLKSTYDAWQNEYRIFWPLSQKSPWPMDTSDHPPRKWLTIPGGFGELVADYRNRRL